MQPTPSPWPPSRQTPWQTCTVANGSGTIGSTDVANVAVTCVTNSYKIGGNVTGLVGAGLVLRNNGGDDLPINTDGSFQFAAGLASGAGYAVTVAEPAADALADLHRHRTARAPSPAETSPTSPSRAPSTTNRSAGIITGLSGTVVLQNNGGDNLVLTANGSFAFPTTLASGATYAVTVQTQPTSPYQICAVTMGTGTVTNAAITDVIGHLPHQQVHRRRHRPRPHRQQHGAAEQRRRRSGPRTDRKLRLPDRDRQRHQLRRDHQDASPRARPRPAASVAAPATSSTPTSAR